MNIFVLDRDPYLAAQYHCDKHVVKMCLESVQLLSAVFHLLGADTDGCYKLTHKNHPCTKWAAASRANFCWLLEHSLGLLLEYKNRYGKTHASWKIRQWIEDRFVHLNFPLEGPTPFAIAMPEFCLVSDDPVECYRYYYMKVKKKFAKWKLGNVPSWYVPISSKENNADSSRHGRGVVPVGSENSPVV